MSDDSAPKNKLFAFRKTWRNLTSDQKISLSVMTFLLVSLPLAILLSLSPLKLFPRAYLPATPPVTPPVSLTPTPSYTVLVNSATNQSCSQVCGRRGLTCVSVGTDTEGTNGISWQKYRNTCDEVQVACDGVMKKTANRLCQGVQQPWTNCNCR